jgi:hypothetical protein
MNTFGVQRSDEKFWSIYDAINSIHLASDPVRSICATAAPSLGAYVLL